MRLALWIYSIRARLGSAHLTSFLSTGSAPYFPATAGVSSRSLRFSTTHIWPLGHGSLECAETETGSPNSQLQRKEVPRP